MNKAITIGNFDGIHLGHRKLLSVLTAEAKARELVSSVLTYTNHPAYTLFHPQQPMLLSPLNRKLDKLRILGVQDTDLVVFDNNFAHISAEDFLKDYLIPKHSPQLIIVGFDSHFGYNREGTYEFLQQHSKKYNYDLIYVEPELHQGTPISSSLIRTKLRAGAIELANRLLGEPYTMWGRVVRGKGLGRTLGFPTANLMLEEAQQLIPAKGIYLSRAQIGDKRYFGLTNLGTSPTVKSDAILEIETFLIDFDADIYDCDMAVSLLSRVRDEKTFGSKEELIEAMHCDLQMGREMMEKYSEA